MKAKSGQLILAIYPYSVPLFFQNCPCFVSNFSKNYPYCISYFRIKCPYFMSNLFEKCPYFVYAYKKNILQLANYQRYD
jgi:hypothetical protein